MKAIRIRLWYVLLLVIPISLVLALVATADRAQQQNRELTCRDSLWAMYIQLLNYRDSQGRYPPAITTGPDGKQMHSWRAHVYAMVRGTLGRDYDMMQAWDGPTNLKLALAVPRMFVCRNNQGEPFRFTNYVAIIDRGVSTLDRANAIPKGSPDEARQVLVIEDPGSVIGWTEPRDLDIAELPRLSAGADPHGIGVLFADGTIRRMSVEELQITVGKRAD